MPALTTLSYHVSGPVVPQASVGAASALVNLGVCYDGADIELQLAVHDIKHDGGGGPDGFETDNIFLNAICTVRFKLVPFAGTYINKLRALSQATATDGTMVVPGTLFGENSMYPILLLPSSDGDGPWRFPTTRVVRAGNNRVSTKETILDFEFRAINYFPIISQTSIATTVLYQRS